MGFIGVAIVNINGLGDFTFTLMGDGFIVISAFLISAASIYGKRLSAAMDVTMMTGYQLTIGGVLLSALFLGEKLLEWRYAIALVLVCAGIGMVNRQAWKPSPR